MTGMIEIKVAELEGEALNWAVAISEGLSPRLEGPHYGNGWRVFCDKSFGHSHRYDPVSNWLTTGSLMGQVIELKQRLSECPESVWQADIRDFWSVGPTQQTAVCRVIARKLGATVSIPRELVR